MNKIQIGNSLIKRSLREELHGIKFENKLTLDQHIKSLSKKANSKLKVLNRVVPYMGLAKNKTKKQMSFFFSQQFHYCALIWIIHSLFKNNRVKYLNERCLQLIYNDKTTSNEEVLEKDGSVSLLRLLLIHFWLKRETIIALDNKIIFFYFLFEQHIMTVKANLT